ncbi:MAG: NAD(P)H:quinone oxidoreductase, type IV, partial [Clostridiaceae bacterium]|nr:NAD(P)H:quinone oxidoreductase, type IV [Clostridiaceae bacterium]
MNKTKIAIVYYSATGINYQLASWAEEAAKEAGADVRLVRIPETA